ncbi:hypothetical protein [Pseudolabrys sp. Root1462]|uniref:hypothetical protein n=1 Tax=Pseudolabrys sp. Root1462 TaxID=1736466 RepID=UPI001AEC3FBE|nr:hypothetical protein [Pseudolabrys sp. Root1462]
MAQADGRYYGMGELTKVPSVSQLINGKAERVVFSMSGISERVLQIANGEAVGVRGQDVRLMLIGFDADWQCLGPGVQLWRGEADYLTVSLDSNGGIQTRTVELSVGSLMTNRRRSPYSYFTDPDQQARSPGDIFCERTPLYQNSVGKKWP